MLRVFDAEGRPGKGASLNLDMLPLVTAGLESAEEHVKSHVGTKF